jgi:hypothetical protein
MWNEIGFEYHPIPTETVKYTKPLRLHGYFQSEKYFADKYTEVSDIIQLPQQQTWIKGIYANESWSGDYPGSPTKTRALVSMHFRIGDCVQNLHIHPLMTVNYYCRALSRVAASAVGPISVLVFYEPCDKDIVTKNVIEIRDRIAAAASADAAAMDDPLHHCQDVQFHFVRDTIVDWQQMLLMSVCDHNIIANSTFSWWGAFLSYSRTNSVCFPDPWFVTGPQIKDLCPPEWTAISR